MLPKVKESVNPSFIPSLCWKVLLILIFLRPFLSEYTYIYAGLWFNFILISFAIIYLVFSPRTIIPRTSLNRPLLIFMVALLASTAFSISWRWSSLEIYWFIPNILIFYIVSKANQKQKKQLIITIITAATIISIYAIYQYLFGFRDALEYLAQRAPNPYAKVVIAGRRVLATFISPNIFAGYEIMMLFIGMGLLVNAVQRKRMPFWPVISISVMIAALLLTKSLGGILIFFITLFLFLFLLTYYLKLKRYNKRMAFLVNLIIVISLIIFIPTSGFFLRHRLSQFLDFNDPQNSIVQRLHFLKTSLNILKDYPFLGIGWRNLGLLYEDYKVAQANISHFSHNCFLQIAVETGPLGLVGFVWIVYIFLRDGLRNLKKADFQQQALQAGLFCAGCAFLLHNLIDLTFYFNQVSFFWWIILGLLNKPIQK